jgi:hypothetical protein
MPTINNGAVPYGGAVVTIGSVAYVATTGETSQGSTIIERRGALNEPTGFVITPDFKRGNWTLQRPTSSQTLPDVGDVIQVPADKLAGITGSIYITERAAAVDQGGIETFRVSVMLAV